LLKNFMREGREGVILVLEGEDSKNEKERGSLNQGVKAPKQNEGGKCKVGRNLTVYFTCLNCVKKEGKEGGGDYERNG